MKSLVKIMKDKKEHSESLSEKFKKELKEIDIKDILIIIAIILIFTTFYSKIDVAKNPCDYCSVCCNGECKVASEFNERFSEEELINNLSSNFELNKKEVNNERGKLSSMALR